MAHGQRVRFEECVLTTTDLYGAVLPDVAVIGCDLRGATVDKANLRSARFHRSNIDGVIGPCDLAGAVSDTAQLVPLALWLAAAAGVSIADDPDDP